MAAPTLQASGTLAAVTTGNLTVTLPTHQANDILVVVVSGWVPNTTTGTNTIAAPSGGWAKLLSDTLINTQIDGEWAIFWLRASASGTTNPVFTRPTSWDTGTDTNWSGRAYVIRGCDPNGDPWDAAAKSALHSTANQAFPAVTVSGAERTVIQFLSKSDDNGAVTAASGWTIDTAATTTSGTDASFQTIRKNDVSSSTTADTATITAPAAGRYQFYGISFKPLVEATPSTVAVTSAVPAVSRVKTTSDWSSSANATTESGGTNATATPAAVAATAAVPAPTVSTGVGVTSPVVTALAAVPSPTLVSAGTGATVSAPVVAVGVAVPAPTTGAGVGATGPVVAVTSTVHSPTIDAAQAANASAAVVAGLVALPPPTVVVSVAVAAPVVAGAAGVLTPSSVTSSASVAAGVVTAGSSVPAPSSITATRTASVSPAAATATASVPAPSVSGSTGATATPSAVAVVSVVPAPTVTLATDATATPAKVGAVSVVPAPRAAKVSAWSAPANATTLASPNASVSPAVVVARGSLATPVVVVPVLGPVLTLASKSMTSISLSWTAVGGAVLYEVERNGIVVAGNVTGTTYTDVGLTPGVTYTHRVRAVLTTSPVNVAAARVAATSVVPAPTVSTQTSRTVSPARVAATSSVPSPSASNGSWPNATNTGYLGSLGALQSISGYTVTTPGAVIEYKRISEALIVAANNVTIRNCVFDAGYFGVIDDAGYSGIIVEDCTFIGGSNCGILLTGSNTIIRRNNVYGGSDGMKVGGNNVLVQDNYIHDLGNPSGDPDPHHDGIQCSSASGLTFEHNWIDSKDTSCIAMFEGQGTWSNVTVNNNYFTGTPGIAVYFPGASGTAPIVCTNNVFAGSFFNSTDWNAAWTWSGNVDENGNVANP